MVIGIGIEIEKVIEIGKEIEKVMIWYIFAWLIYCTFSYFQHSICWLNQSKRDNISTEQTHNFNLAYGKSVRIVFLISIHNIW